MWRRLGIFGVILGCLAPALAFAHATSPSAKPVSTSTTSSASILRLAIPDTSPTVDPDMVADEENVQLANLLYTGLVRLDSSYHLVLDAAARYTLSPDHKTYTFYLRHGLRFSNGDPVTATDFQYSMTRSLNQALKSPSAPTYLLDIEGAAAVLAGKAKTVSGIKVLNPYTLRITVRWPVPYFLMELTWPTSFALDEKRIAKLGPIDNSAWYTNPIGSGPYRLKSWAPNSTMVLVPNKYFQGPRPSLKEITISLGSIPDKDTYAYVIHNLDVTGLPNDRNLWHLPGIDETNMLSIDGLYMNMKVKPFGNLNVRRALTMALNRSVLVSKAWGAAVTPFAGFVPSGQMGYDPQLKPLPYDVSAARAALKAAGYPGGKNFPSMILYYPAELPQYAKLAQAMVKAWHKNLGISVDTKAQTSSALITNAESGSLPLYLSGWSADYPDPHDWLSGQWRTDALNNNVGYSSKQFDQRVETADVTWNYNQRMQLYNQAQQILVNDATWIPLFLPHRLAYIRPGVDNLVLTGYGIMPRSGSWADIQVHIFTPKRRRAL
jgi:ABC-type oligopeptide transport system substrate-binding subunit